MPSFDPSSAIFRDAVARATGRPVAPPPPIMLSVGGVRVPWPPRPIAASTRRLIKLGVSAIVRDAERRAAEARGEHRPDLALSATAAHARLPAVLRDALKRAAANAGR